MSMKTVSILLIHDLKMSLKGLLIFQLFLAPLSLWLIIYLLFGQMAIGKPAVGLLVDENSTVVQAFHENSRVYRYSTKENILGELEKGILDLGLIFSEEIDTAIRTGQEGSMTILISGEAPLQRRVQAFMLLQRGIISAQGREPVVVIETVKLGKGEIKPWYQRLLPLVVLIAVMMGGIFIPATSITDDKQRHTYQALLAAPVENYEIMQSKMLLGALVSFLMGLMILLLNGNLSGNAVPVMIVLLLVALSAASLGCIIGYVSKDMKAVTTLAQSLMLLMYAPAILNIFPQVPDWVQKLFPTYYFFSPLLRLSDHTIALEHFWEIGVLIVILLVTIMLVKYVSHRSKNIIM